MIYLAFNAKCSYPIPGSIYLNTNVVFGVRQAPLAIRTGPLLPITIAHCV